MATMVIEPIGGLGNRLRALDSAIAYAHSCPRRLTVLWIRNPALNCRFRDLFECPQAFTRLVDMKTGSAVSLLRHMLRAYHTIRPNHWLGNQAITDWKARGGSALECINATLRASGEAGSVYLQTHSYFFRMPGYTPYSAFMPNPQIRERIERYHTAGMVGVHIRRSDNHIAAAGSPLELYLAAMRHEIEQDAAVQFYLATDDSGVKRLLLEMFPGRIVYHPLSSSDRGNPLAIQDAVVDLYCLANCRKLIGSYWSSFSDVAAAIHGIEKVIIRADAIPAGA